MRYHNAAYVPDTTTEMVGHSTDPVLTAAVFRGMAADGAISRDPPENRIPSKEDDSNKKYKRNLEMPLSQEHSKVPTMDNEEGVPANDFTHGVTILRSSNGLVVTSDLSTSFINAKIPPPEVVAQPTDVRSEEVSLRTHLCSMGYLVVVVLTPIVLLPIIFSVDEKYKKAAGCGYTIAIMAIFWLTECLPIAVTSLLPVILLPLLGVMSAKTVSASYFNDTSMLFLGGITGAIAVEIYGVHKRIALLVLRVTGSEPRRLLLGMSLVTWFLSMWISNTATTAMMMTTSQALLQQFKDFKDSQTTNDTSINVGSTKEATNSESKDHDLEMDQQRKKQKSDAEFLRLGKALSLTVAYSANIGGIGCLTGTGPNLVLFAAAQKVFEDVGLRSPVTFGTWMVYAMPMSLLLLLIMLLWMVVVILRCKGGCGCCRHDSESKNEYIQKVNQMIREEYTKLGPVTYAQAVVVVSFLLMLLAWVTRDLGEEGGWKNFFPRGYVADSTPCVLFAVMMFTLPSSVPWSGIARCQRTAPYRRITPLLTWKRLEQKMPWSLFLLLGGGFAMARAATDSGLSSWIGSQLLVFRELNHWVILLIICYIVTFVTEVTSNTAIATLMMPILSEMAIGLGLNPLFLMFPGAITTSFAFMLPVATPPNAIVFSYGIVRVVDMVLSGLFLNLISVPVLLFATATWGNAFFKFDQMPPEFSTNFTIISPKI